MKRPITVIKRDFSGEEVWRYEGVLLHQDARKVILDARFSREDTPILNSILKKGDRFVETYFSEDWYNIFEIHDRDDDHIKGWYCNIGKPAVMESENGISYVDLALDLWVSPDGKQTVLDEDEFAALNLDEQTKSKAQAALDELRARFLMGEFRQSI